MVGPEGYESLDESAKRARLRGEYHDDGGHVFGLVEMRREESSLVNRGNYGN